MTQDLTVEAELSELKKELHDAKENENDFVKDGRNNWCNRFAKCCDRIKTEYNSLDLLDLSDRLNRTRKLVDEVAKEIDLCGLGNPTMTVKIRHLLNYFERLGERIPQGYVPQLRH